MPQPTSPLETLFSGVHRALQASSLYAFPAAVENPRSLHLFFLAQTPKSPDLDALSRLAVGREAFALKGKIFYLHTPDGFAESKLRSRVERFTGVDATARNWRTVSALNALAQDLE
jgi:uncharacterized protein (DUF1697 family)